MGRQQQETEPFDSHSVRFRLRKEDQISRRELAHLLGVHPDSVSRMLPDGLAVAVVEWGGRGKETLFDQPLALRFWNAKTCPIARSGGYCYFCRSALEDCKNVGEHLIEARHAYGGCSECRCTHEVTAPCRGVDLVYR